MTASALSVVVPSYRGRDRLPRTLGSLELQDVPGGFEVIVVDDGSDDGTADTAGAFAARLALKVLSHERNRGRAAAANTGIRAAAGSVVLLLDDDMEAAPGMLRLHLDAHRVGGRQAVLGRIVHEGLDPADPFQAFLLKEENWRRKRLLEGGEVSFGEVWTGQFSVERALALEVGLFDEGIGLYGLEDIEFAYRLSRAETRFVYLDEAVSLHAAYAVDLDRYCERHRMVGEVAAYVARRHPDREMRRYLRLESPPRVWGRSVFLRMMDFSASLLRRRGIAAVLAGPIARPVLRWGVRLLEALRFRRLLSFAYSFLRDVEYFAALGRAMRRDEAGEGTSR